MPTLIYSNELNGYPDEESNLIKRNLAQTIDPAAQAVAPNKPPAKNWRSMIRATSTSYNFLILVLLAASIVEASFVGYAVDYSPVFIAAVMMSVYYLYNIIDYSRDYLFSDQVEKSVYKMLQSHRYKNQRSTDRQ